MVMSENNISSVLHEPYALTAEQKTYYRKNGFIRLKDVIPADVLDYYTPFIEAAVGVSGDDPLDEQLAKDAKDPTYSRAFKQVINIWAKPEHAKVKELAFSKRLARIAAELMGDDVTGVRMYHDQALFKWPGGGHTPYHADQFYWPLQSEKTVTAWMPLSAVPTEMGPLEFVAGSQNADLGRSVGIGIASDAAVSAAVKQGGYELITGPFEAGEVSFHSGWTFHKAPPNTTTDKTRKVLTVIYMDKDMKMAEPLNDNQRADANRYLTGVEVGKVCDGPLNPILWGKEEEKAIDTLV
ncbi:hypothetical protein Ndes2526B_g04306 [Nannochloris sp. 'desiccata']